MLASEARATTTCEARQRVWACISISYGNKILNRRQDKRKDSTERSQLIKQQEHKSELLPVSTKSEDVRDRMCGVLVLQGLRSSETRNCNLQIQSLIPILQGLQCAGPEARSRGSEPLSPHQATKILLLWQQWMCGRLRLRERTGWGI